jgi:hypothetical protein
VIKDPLTAWDGPFPYDELAPVGVTPEVSHAAMADVSFELMTRRMMNSRTQKAWDELRTMRRRLLIDLLLYDVDPAEELGRARTALAAERSDPGEPPQVAQALTISAGFLDELAGELADVELPEPPPLGHDPQFGMFPSSVSYDDLIQFDR